MKIVLSLFFLIAISFSALAQQAEVIVPVGHSAPVNAMAYSKLLGQVVTGAGLIGADGIARGCDLKIWDLSSGTELATLNGYKSPVAAVTFAHGSQLLAGGSSDGNLIIWDRKNETETLHLTVGTDLRYLFFTADDRNIISVGHEVRCWDIATGKMQYEAATAGHAITSAAYDDVADILATTDRSKKLNIYHNGKLLDASEIFSKECLSVGFDEQHHLLCLGADIDLLGNISTIVKSINLQSAAITTVKQLTNQTANLKYVFSHNGALVTAQGATGISITKIGFDVPLMLAGRDNFSLVAAAKGEVITATMLDPNSSWIAAAISDTAGHQEVKIYPISGTVQAKNTSLTGHVDIPKHVFFTQGDSAINIIFNKHQANWNLKNGLVNFNTLKTAEYQLSALGNYSYVKTPGGGIAVTSKLGKPDAPSAKLSNASLVAFSGDDKLILTRGAPDDMELRLYRSSDLKPMKAFRQLDTVWDIHLMNNGKLFVTAGADHTARLWNAEKGMVERTFRGHSAAVNKIAVSADELLLATSGLDNLIKVWDITTGALRLTLKGHDQPVNSLGFSADGSHLVSGSDDHTVRLWDLKSGLELGRFYAVDSTDYMVNTTEGYYMSTPDATRKLRFKINGNIFSFNQFDLQFNRPDKVMAHLGTASPALIAKYQRIADKRLKKMGFTPELFEIERSVNVPEVQIINKNSLPLIVANRDFKFQIQANDDVYNLDRLQVYINGVPLYGARGLSLKQRATHKLIYDVHMQLSAGENLIETTILNEKGVESLKDQLSVNFNGVVSKPNLYVIAIGVSRYQDSTRNLHFAAKDAGDIAQLFSRASANLSKTVVVSIANEHATKTEILAAKKILTGSTTDDQVIVFYAGHGVPDDQLDYYLGTYDMDFSKPASKGLLYSDLEGLLDEIPARQKLLIIDACHAGEIDKDDAKVVASNQTKNEEVGFRGAGNKTISISPEGDNAFEIMKQMFVDLRVSTGTTVIASAGGAEVAFESSAWRNGAFTFCLLKGLQGQEADRNHDGKIKVSELVSYLQENVAKLTGGMQKPVSRIQNLLNDLSIW